MNKFILTILLTLIIANFLAVTGILGYGTATGRFDPQWRNQYVATWRGEKLVPEPNELLVAEEEGAQQASVRIEEREIGKEVLTREMQQEIERLRNMKFTLELARKKLNKELNQLHLEKEAFAQQLAEQENQAQQEGFQKALKGYSEMKSKFVKEDFMKMADEDVVRYISAMKTDTATAILNQFRTPAEQEKRQRVMKLLENHKVVEIARTK